MKTKGVIYCGLFTALIAVGAFIKIPIPVVPFTLQYLFTMLAGLLLGSRLGTVSVLSYMLLGLAGLPIFSEGGCGLYRIRFNWTSDFHTGRRTGIYFPAEFWIYHRICSGYICDWMDCGTYGKKDHCTVPSGKSGRTVLCLCSRYDLLLYHL